jgi:hypothetical protein
MLRAADSVTALAAPQMPSLPSGTRLAVAGRRLYVECRALPKWGLSVYLFPISDGDDQNEKPVIMDLVKHPKGPEPDTPSRASGQFLAARRRGSAPN